MAAGKRTLYNAFEGKNNVWDPFGIAKFDLSDLLFGQQILYLKSPIMNCPLPDVLGVRDGKMDGKVLGVPGSLDGPSDVPFRVGSYLQSDAMLKICVEVAHPLATPAEVAEKPHREATMEVGTKN